MAKTTPVGKVFKELKPLGDNMQVRSKFAHALIAERDGDDKAAEAYLNEAITLEVAAKKKAS